MTSTEPPSLETRVGRLEIECHGIVDRQKADRTLMEALHITQAEHGRKLDVLIKGQERLGSDVAVLKTDTAEVKGDIRWLKVDVAVLKTDMAEVKGDIRGLKTDVADLKTDVSGLKTDMADVKGGMVRLETLVRQALHLPEH